MIRIEGVKVTYKDKVALDIVRPIEIQDGDRVGIIGSNGAGKTTLIKSILGIVPYSGLIKSKIPPHEIAVHMQQNEYSTLLPIKVVMETILGGPIEKNAKVMEMIEYFNFEDCLKKRWKQLSGGQKQRLTLILVMSQESPITMMDEVTSGLDFETRQKLMEHLNQWYENRKATLLITSHYYEELNLLADKILFLDQGKVIDYGTKADLFAKYCGYSVLVADENEATMGLKKKYTHLIGAPKTVVFRCDNREIEEEISQQLIYLNVNYRRSNNDTEIMTINAKANYYGEGNS